MYIILFIVLSVINNGRLFSEHDEFNHWALIIKNMFLFNTYGTNPQSIVEFNEYPPFTAIFQYLFLAINKTYSEDIIITAQGMLYFSLVIPIMKNINWNKSIKNIMAIVPIMIALPMIFYKNFYLEILVDGILGVMFATTIFYAYEDEELKFKYIKIFSALVMLCLTKTTGIALAVLASIIILIRLCTNQKLKQKEIIIFICVCVITAILTLMWYMEVFDSTKKWDFSQYISNESQVDKIEVGKKFIKTIFLDQCITDKKITTFAITLILICSNMYITNMHVVKNEKRKNSLKYYSTAMIFSIFIYIIMQFITYVSIFEVSEAENLDCFDRYISTIFLATAMYQILVINEKIKDKYDFKKIMIILTLIICLLPQENIMIKYVGAKNYIVTEKNNRNFYTKITKYKNTLNADDTVLIINGSKEDSKKIKLINQYEIMPTKVNAVNMNIDSGEELQKIIKDKKYGYVFMYKIKDDDKDKIKEKFEGQYVENDTLYKVTNNDGQIFLELVRK